MLYDADNHSSGLPGQANAARTGIQQFPLVVGNSQNLVAEGIQALLHRAGYRFISIANNEQQMHSQLSTQNRMMLIVSIEFLFNELSAGGVAPCQLAIDRTIVTCNEDQLVAGTRFVPKEIGGIVSVNNRFALLLDALNTVRLGRQFIDPSLADLWEQRCTRPRLEVTNRQIEIILHVANGKSSREIAEILGLSRKTIDNHRTRIRQRMGVSSSAEMVNVAKQNGWI